MTTPITQLLERWRTGETGAADALMNAVYPLLRELAQQRLRRHAHDATLQPTELANEAYARLHQARTTGCAIARFFISDAWDGRVVGDWCVVGRIGNAASEASTVRKTRPDDVAALNCCAPIATMRRCAAAPCSNARN
jgi:hypothetical protein